MTFEDEVGQLAQGTEKKIGRVRVQRTVREISIMEKVLIGRRASHCRIGESKSRTRRRLAGL